MSYAEEHDFGDNDNDNVVAACMKYLTVQRASYGRNQAVSFSHACNDLIFLAQLQEEFRIDTFIKINC